VANSPKSEQAQARLAAALRENLKRRKAKSRDQGAREQAAQAGESAPVSPGAATPPDPQGALPGKSAG
jgi:hypothetical protein